MKTRLLLTFLLGGALCLCTLRPMKVSAKDFGIGSQAPPLDIEHWIQDGNGFFSPVKKFKQGSVYVVEFWATWCGPCIASMPHLAELQNKYRGQNVQIISVSDETLDEVKDLLAQDNEEVGKTFAEITSAYSLTTDPDRSVHEDYMEAADQQGIPTSFIVGKTGVIEWIGHPMDLDDPLEAVVNDAWDRERFKEELRIQKEFEENLEKVSMLAGAKRFDDALKLAAAQIKKAKPGPMREQWIDVQSTVKMFAGRLDDDALTYFRSRLAELKGKPYEVGRFGFSIYRKGQEGADVGPLAADATAAIAEEVKTADEDLQPLLYNTMAMLYDLDGRTKQAIEAQQAAIDASDDQRRIRRLMPFLEELKEKAAKANADETKPSKPADKKES